MSGVVRMLEILEDEIVTTMGLLGITALRQMTPDYICAAEPVTPLSGNALER
jgi:isopentenyl diphosphate isomerase/L-lactate dehydrogenase-like FMN-dependent dehydrogenase